MQTQNLCYSELIISTRRISIVTDFTNLKPGDTCNGLLSFDYLKTMFQQYPLIWVLHFISFPTTYGCLHMSYLLNSYPPVLETGNTKKV